jgi:hypothetical protein
METKGCRGCDSDGLNARTHGLRAYEGKADWLDVAIAHAKDLPHKSPTLQRAMKMFDEPITSNRNAYARFLEETVLVAADYSNIVEQCGGVPIGVEFRSIHRRAWAVIRDCSKEGGNGFILAMFDSGDLVTERVAETAEHALDAMVSDGFLIKEDSELHGVYRKSMRRTQRHDDGFVQGLMRWLSPGRLGATTPSPKFYTSVGTMDDGAEGAFVSLASRRA